MNAKISFQDCERKAPPTEYPVTAFEEKPSGINLKFSKGMDPRTRRPNVYSVMLTIAIKSGEWTSVDDEGDIEHITETKLPQGNRIEGIWTEAGERRVVILEITGELPEH